MAGVTEAEEQPVATPKTPRSTLVRSASSFPQSFPVINRNFSNASSVFGEPAEDQFPQPDRQPAAATAPVTEQVEERQAEIPISDATVAGEQAPADKAAENAAETGISSAAGTHRLNEGSIHAPSCSGQMQQVDTEAEGQLPSSFAEEPSSPHSVTAVGGSGCSAASVGPPTKQTAGEGATEEGGEPAELDDTENLLAKGLGSKEPSGLESSLQAAEANGVPGCADHPVDAVPNGSKSGDVADSANTEEGTAKAGCDADQVIQARDNAERTEGASLEAGDTGNGGSGCLAVATPRETLEPRGSRTSLSPESEPFVPSQGSSQQVTPRASDKGGGSASLNANAATFVPSFGMPAGDPAAPVSTAFPVQLRFGSLPDSLNPSPHISATDQPEWPVYNHNGCDKGHPGSYENGHQGEDSAYSEQGQEWHAWERDYDPYNPAYADGAYTHEDGSQYYQQEDGTWVSYWAEDESGSHWQGHYEGAAQEQATSGDYKHGNGYYKNGGYENRGYENGGYENGGSGGYYDSGGSYENGYGGLRGRRGGRGSKRGPGRRQPGEGHRAWQSAAVDILEQQFHFSRECLQEMLDLHEGNFEVVLDMLAQLEAEQDGQLPASSQDAPELNEENFPSLGSNGSIGERADALPQASKVGFAEAVRTAASPAPPPPKTEATPDAGGHRHRAGPTEGTRSMASMQVPWKETGAAVSEAYADARAIARDHARLRNTYFQEATKAFLAGNKALAKELGVKGRKQSELMKAAHAEASKSIYKHRNPVSGRGKGRSPGLVDLHGLHVKEAVAVLEREVAAARRASKPRSGRASPPRMSVLVGTGHHTKGSRTPSRLPAAIEDWLLASQISFTRPSPGLLELTL